MACAMMVIRWSTEATKEELMATAKQRAAARRNIKKASATAKGKRSIVHQPKRTRTALGQQGAKAARRKHCSA
jgi:hypothetical protein